jgi:beta-lactamase class A
MLVPDRRRHLATATAALAVATAAAVAAQVPAEVLVDTLRRATGARLESAATAADGVVGYVIADLDGPDRFARLADAPFPAASTIKLALLYELFKQADAGDIALDETAPLDRSRAVPGGLLFELTTPALSPRDLAVAMILQSDNTATNVLIDRLGMAAVNARLDALGLQGTRLQRHMIDVDAARDGRENLTTPSDLARLLRVFHYGEGLSAPSAAAALEILKKPKQTPIRTGVPTDVEVASKPGGLAGMRADAGIVYLPGRPYVFVAMGTFLGEGPDVEAPLEQLARISAEYFTRRATVSAYGRQLH